VKEKPALSLMATDYNPHFCFNDADTVRFAILTTLWNDLTSK